MSLDLNNFKKSLTAAGDWLKKEFQQIRTGMASPSVLDSVKVEAYGSAMSLKEVAAVTLEGARTLRVSPWDKNQIKDIEKAITSSNLGLSVAVDDQGLRINFPALTQESRQKIVKTAKEKLEESRKQIRHCREDFLKELQDKEKAGGLGKDDVFRLKGDVQKIVDEENRKLEEVFAKKEKEIMSE